MKKLLLIAAALAIAAAPAMAENAKSSARSLIPFGPHKYTWQGDVTPYPHDRVTAGDTDADSGHATEHDLTSATHGHVTYGDMDSDTGQTVNG